MNINESVHACGQVRPSFIDTATGVAEPWSTRHNTLSYDAAKAIARSFGGDLSQTPSHIGIIYGPSGQTFGTVLRGQNWSALKADMESRHTDVQVRPFSYSPTLTAVSRGASSDSSPDESGYGVVFHVHSDSTTPGAFGSCAGSAKFTAQSSIYQAVLLSKSNGVYTILARVDLGDNGVYRKKPDNFELALDWTVKFF